MTEDTRKEMERLEKELLTQEPEQDILDDAVIRSIMAEPAFDDETTIHDPEGPMVYCNFSNDYGRGLKKQSQGEDKPAHKDKVNTVLMFIASGLCLGIVGILAYWLIKYL